MRGATYSARRGELETYFDRTASEAWARLTSDAPVSGIRATVRAGRAEMRATLLSWLPQEMAGLRLLDAGCGTGALANEAAARGAQVVAVDLAASLIAHARERAATLPGNQPDFRVGDMLDESLGVFDHVVAMDSLIHYSAEDIVEALARVAPRCRRSLLFTVAPRTPLLAAFHALGRLFPRGDRAPAIEPLAEARLRRLIATEPRLRDFAPGRHRRVARGFYTSHAYEWVRR
ncbi:MAG: magnesium protoporphyrin IX methyltransferase [Roseococcus sp.]